MSDPEFAQLRRGVVLADEVSVQPDVSINPDVSFPPPLVRDFVDFINYF